MLEKIKQFRKRTYGERKRATIIISVSLMLVITFVWGTAILPRMFTAGDQTDMRAESITPFKTLSEDLGVVWGDFQSGMSVVGEMFTDILGGQEEIVPTHVPDGVIDFGTRGEVPEAIPIDGQTTDAGSGDTRPPGSEADPLRPEKETPPTEESAPF